MCPRVLPRFFAGLADLDDRLQAPLPPEAIETLIQAPLTDALTHVGQLALLRGLHGATIRPESYAPRSWRVDTRAI